jgi:uncharacterized protein (TIGR02145 family)
MNRIAFKFIGFIVVFLIISIVSLNCKKSETQEKKFPSTKEELEISLKNTRRIVNESGSIVDSAISKAINQNGLIDPNEIARQVKLINGVVSATPTPSGTGIVLEMEDSTFVNLLLVSEDDERLFNANANNSSKEEIISNYKSSKDLISPNGSKKALILAPFQKSFNTDLKKISELLNAAGYNTDNQYIDEAATLDRFRGSFLSKFDVIFIRTHGNGNWATRAGERSTVLLTGEEFTGEKTLTNEEIRALSLARPLGSNTIYWALSVPFLNLTTGGKFTNSWIYAGGCETAMVKSGTSSMSAAFLNLGAGGYSGFDETIDHRLSNPVALKMTSEFCSGLSFKEASANVRSDPSLLALPEEYPTLGNEVNVNLFDDIQNSTDQFYLIKPKLPTLSTVDMSSITSTSAVGGGNISTDGGAFITEKGVCWNTSPNPTIGNSRTIDGTGSNNFISNLIGLTTNTLYYVRAYATNSVGTAYGTNEVSFTTSSIIHDLIDVDGNSYNIVTIGTQVWMKENLKVTKYNDGSVIPKITDPTQWTNLTTGAFCWYDNNSSNKDIYGALYNWYTVDVTSNGGKNVCPTGWHVPTDAEWTTLTDFLGGANVSSGKLKETGLIHWFSPNAGATNETGFTALPAGWRESTGTFWDLSYFGSWWSTTENSTTSAWDRVIHYESTNVYRGNGYKPNAFSIRCIKNN